MTTKRNWVRLSSSEDEPAGPQVPIAAGPDGSGMPLKKKARGSGPTVKSPVTQATTKRGGLRAMFAMDTSSGSDTPRRDRGVDTETVDEEEDKTLSALGESHPPPSSDVDPEWPPAIPDGWEEALDTRTPGSEVSIAHPHRSYRTPPLDLPVPPHPL
ncbi:hypothetical protein FA13DRAFT_1788583 [Coprinellus micaceus]|uniref:Uncharacterized protein n=1 Tax=Coprinellus micaceus TaxID=71717 RepID=A0A4Y7TLA9_COPMI|nr:hypothetical protein FA13DRAFT_1788583 [Coprinellus micaceus]